MSTDLTSPEHLNFASMPLTPEVQRALSEIGFERPTPVQAATYGPAIEGRDLIIQSRTGTGKTAAFGLPLVDRLIQRNAGVQALVLAPTRELALQSARELARIGVHRGVKTAAVYGGASMEKQIDELRGGAHVVSGTPGRVLDHMRRGTLEASGIRILVLDEADEMLSMGFAIELNQILDLLPKARQTILLSATIDDAVMRVANRSMTDPVFVALSSDAIGAAGIAHFAYHVTGKAREQELVRILAIEAPQSAIVFCNTKADTERVAAHLQAEGLDADWLNGDLPQKDRETVMGKMRRGELRFLVATDVAARGIDISNVTHVVNYTFPDSPETYVHRTGRTGRAGRTGTAISLISPQELGALYYLRLQFGIQPVERSLPTRFELDAQREADQVAVLAQAFSRGVGDPQLALARRIATHPDAERIVAGLAARYFDDALATPVAPVRVTRAVVEVESAPPEPTAEAPKPRRRRPTSAGTEAAPVDAEIPRERPRRRERSAADAPAESTEQSTASEPQLFVNLGRKSGIKPGDLLALLSDRASVPRGEIGRIRIRDSHSYIALPEAWIAAAVEALHGTTYQDVVLTVERAKGGNR